jgi:hypothetical protein
VKRYLFIGFSTVVAFVEMGMCKVFGCRPRPIDLGVVWGRHVVHVWCTRCGRKVP